jgi:hypothetical protein
MAAYHYSRVLNADNSTKGGYMGKKVKDKNPIVPVVPPVGTNSRNQFR